MLVVGPTGIGKSTSTMQAALCWAVGREHFGVVPARPLRSLIIQSENDHGDLAEMRDGIFNGVGFTEEERRLANERGLADEAEIAGLLKTTAAGRYNQTLRGRPLPVEAFEAKRREAGTIMVMATCRWRHQSADLKSATQRSRSAASAGAYTDREIESQWRKQTRHLVDPRSIPEDMAREILIDDDANGNAGIYRSVEAIQIGLNNQPRILRWSVEAHHALHSAAANLGPSRQAVCAR